MIPIGERTSIAAAVAVAIVTMDFYLNISSKTNSSII
jgi:hypothetical protein